MVGIERLGVEGTAVDDAILVTTRDGALLDLGPVIRAGLVIQERLEANPPGVVAVLLGMRIAVGKVCGSEAAKAFEEWVYGGIASRQIIPVRGVIPQEGVRHGNGVGSAGERFPAPFRCH